VIYDLPCPRGHHTLISEPHIARAMRKAKGSWVTFKGSFSLKQVLAATKAELIRQALTPDQLPSSAG